MLFLTKIHSLKSDHLEMEIDLVEQQLQDSTNARTAQVKIHKMILK